MTDYPQISTPDLISLVKLVDKKLWETKELGFDNINKDFETLDPATMSIEAMLAWLRGSFSAKDKIDEWRPFLRRAYNEVIVTRGENRPNIFRGMIKYLDENEPLTPFRAWDI